MRYEYAKVFRGSVELTYIRSQQLLLDEYAPIVYGIHHTPVVLIQWQVGEAQVYVYPPEYVRYVSDPMDEWDNTETNYETKNGYFHLWTQFIDSGVAGLIEDEEGKLHHVSTHKIRFLNQPEE